MNVAFLQQRLPAVQPWIAQLLTNHRAAARPVAAFSWPRLGRYFSAPLLASAKVVPVPRVPIPPLASLGLDEFSEFERMEAAGITYHDTYFVREELLGNETLHFHELVHVVQWRELGGSLFPLAYAVGYLLGPGYRLNPLEIIAYDLQARFESGEGPWDVEREVREHLATVVRPALERCLNAAP
jgi:hypothetical protein